MLWGVLWLTLFAWIVSPKVLRTLQRVVGLVEYLKRVTDLIPSILSRIRLSCAVQENDELFQLRIRYADLGSVFRQSSGF